MTQLHDIPGLVHFLLVCPVSESAHWNLYSLLRFDEAFTAGCLLDANFLPEVNAWKRFFTHVTPKTWLLFAIEAELDLYAPAMIARHCKRSSVLWYALTWAGAVSQCSKLAENFSTMMFQPALEPMTTRLKIVCSSIQLSHPESAWYYASTNLYECKLLRNLCISLNIILHHCLHIVNWQIKNGYQISTDNDNNYIVLEKNGYA